MTDVDAQTTDLTVDSFVSELTTKTREGRLTWELLREDGRTKSLEAIAAGSGIISLRVQLISGIPGEWFLTIDRVPTPPADRFDMSFARELKQKGMSSRVLSVASTESSRVESLATAVTRQLDERNREQSRVGEAFELVRGL